MSADTSALKTANLAYQPPAGGTPASDARNTVITTAMPGETLNRPL